MADYSVRDSVAILQMNNPRVNALNSKVRTGLGDGIKRAIADKDVVGVVICGKGRNFCAGADIKEFDSANKGTWITDVGDMIDSMKKPVVAAISGFALGGGLEVALFCHYRIALKTAKSTGHPPISMADYSVRDSVAILQMNNPRVNALNSKVRTGLGDGIKRAIADKDVVGVVICGKGRNFCAGADIKEFDAANKGTWITDVGDMIDGMKKPVVAAISGFALGGGLEVALFCHYRIAQKTAKVGQPEVQIGLLPGAGGTQRLPRAAGLSNALDIITTGNHVSAEKAQKMGIIDQLVSGDITEEGIKFVKTKAHIDTSLVCLRNRKVKVEGDLDQISDVAMKRVKTKYKGFIAPIYCVRAVLNSVSMPYDKGMDLERDYFMYLKTGVQSKAQRYAFFAERQVQRWQMPNGGNYKTAKPHPIRTTGVLGAGTMGSGIALSLITSGFPCVLVEQNEEFLKKGVEVMKQQLMGTVRLGKMTEDQAKKCFQTLKPTVNFDELKNVDLVIEAVYEDLKLKRDIFKRLDNICKPQAILCTNTSTLDIDKIASVTRRPDKVVGTHFFAPSYIMKLLENIYGSKTSPETVATVMKLGKDIKKVPVLVGTCTGFVANRMNGPFGQEAQFVVEEGLHIQDVDEIIKLSGVPFGTFQVSDIAGIDVSYKIRKEAAKESGETLTPDSRFFMGQRNSGLVERMIEHGRLGKKNCKGWYKYDSPTAKIGVVDPEVTKIVDQHCKQLGIERRRIGPQEVTERTLYSMINEGFKILEEGICTMPEEIDIIWIYGFSWPKFLGGPMFYASQIGLKTIYDRICYYHRKFPFSAHWVPSSLLKTLSETDLLLSEWGRATKTSKL